MLQQVDNLELDFGSYCFKFLLLCFKGAPFEERLEAAKQLLATVPLIDGHNDLPWNIRKFLHNQLNGFEYV